MSCFSSYGCMKCKNGQHEVDIALDVINCNQLRIGCLNCSNEFYLKITKKQFKELYDFWNKEVQGAR